MISIWYQQKAHHFYFLTPVFLYNVTVWLVTMVTHSPATDYNKYHKTHIFYAKFERKHKIAFRV